MAKCVQVWVNELRATDYFESGGWAALARTTLDLADFGQVGLSVGTTRFGFGSIEQRPQERSRENTTNIDLTTKFELGKFFGHGLGHGLGRLVHDTGRLSPTSTDIIEVGQVWTIEPGAYVPGFGGVRIEDDVVVEENGVRRLTHSTKELLVLPNV
jgi:hypothetical protein